MLKVPHLITDEAIVKLETVKTVHTATKGK